MRRHSIFSLQMALLAASCTSVFGAAVTSPSPVSNLMDFQGGVTVEGTRPASAAVGQVAIGGGTVIAGGDGYFNGYLYFNTNAANNGSGCSFGIAGEGQSRLGIYNSGSLLWGSGTAAFDTSLARSGVGVLTTGGTFIVNGKLGIGTATPGNLLTVVGSSPGSTGALSVSRVDIGGGPPAASGTIDPNQIAGFGNPAVTFRMGLYQNGDTWMLPSYAGDYSVNLNTVFNPYGGSVGVGIQPTNSRGALQVAFHGAPGGQPTHTGSTDPNQFCTLGNINVALRIGDYLNGDVWLQPSLINDYATDHNLVLNPNNGNVVIGTGTGTVSNKLTVFGVISAKEIKVTSTGADYVFEDGYALRPLADVEAFVTRERHLPDVMTAKEMGDSGLPVAQVVTVQLAKIEELTLYAIQQQKLIDGLMAQQKVAAEASARQDAALAQVLAKLAAFEAERGGKSGTSP